jgi:Tfp pilus assembly protein PilF
MQTQEKGNSGLRSCLGPVTSRLSCTLMLACFCQLGAHATSAEAIYLNNEGVRELNAGDFETAIKTFEQALIVDHTYTYARDNLRIAHNNYGRSKEKEPEIALREFQKASFLDPKDSIVKDNIEESIKLLKKDPHSFSDRIALAKSFKDNGDLVGAAVEYEAALKIKGDPTTRDSLVEAYQALSKGKDEEAKRVAQGLLDKLSASGKQSTLKGEIDR